VNKKTSIEIDSVRQKMNDLRVVAMRADNSKASPEIDEALREFDRAGVPLNLVYPADSSSRPIVLPEILTPGIVLDALDQAAGEG
jgi:thiol:disulfide interchange protein DsbD